MKRIRRTLTAFLMIADILSVNMLSFSEVVSETALISDSADYVQEIAELDQVEEETCEDDLWEEDLIEELSFETETVLPFMWDTPLEISAEVSFETDEVSEIETTIEAEAVEEGTSEAPLCVMLEDAPENAVPSAEEPIEASSSQESAVYNINGAEYVFDGTDTLTVTGEGIVILYADKLREAGFDDETAALVKTLILKGRDTDRGKITRCENRLALPNLETLVIDEGLVRFYDRNHYYGSPEQMPYTKLQINGSLEYLDTVGQTFLREVDADGRLGTFTFESCTALEQVRIACWSANHMGDAAFNQAAALKSVVIEDMLSDTWTMGSHVFNGCSSLTSLEVPAALTGTLQGSFSNCSELEVFPDMRYVEELKGPVFENCRKLKEMYFYSGLTVTGGYTFAGCSSLEKVWFSHLKVLEGRDLFIHCTSLQSVEAGFMDQPAKPDSCAFYGCSALTDLILPAGISVLAEGAFTGCRSLRSIPDLTKLDTLRSGIYGSRLTAEEQGDTGIFSGCSSLEEICFDLQADLTAMNYFEKNWMNKFVFKGDENLKKVVLPGNVGSFLPSEMFLGCGSLEELDNLANQPSLTTINQDVFRGCVSLKELKLPDTITSLGSVPEGLEEFSVPPNAADCGKIFADCFQLRKLSVPSTVTKFDLKCSYDIEKVALECIPSNFHGKLDGGVIGELYIGEGVVSIPAYQFYQNTSLVRVYLPNGLETIESSAFSQYSASSADTDYLEYVQIPQSVTRIGSSAFRCCSRLDQATLPEGLTQLGSYAFTGCTSLQEITVPGSLTDWGTYSFSESGLSSVLIADGITAIPSGTFSGAAALEELFLPDQVEQFGTGCISGTALHELRVSDQTGLKLKKSDLQTGHLDTLRFQGRAFETEEKETAADAVNLIFDEEEVTLLLPIRFSKGTHNVYFRQGNITFGENGGFSFQAKTSASEAPNELDMYFGRGVETISGKLSTVNFGSLVIHGFTGSTAENFAKTNNYTFVPIDEDEPIPWDSFAGEFKYKIIAGEAVVTGYVGKDAAVEIPETLEGYPVVGMARGTGTTIGRRNPNKMEELTIPASVTNVEPDFVYWSRKLRKIHVAEDNLYFSSDEIALYSKDRTTLYRVLPAAEEYAIPDTVTVIADEAFKDCKIVQLQVPDKVTQLGEAAFKDSAIAELTLGRGIIELPEHVLEGCKGLTLLTVNGNLTRIGEAALCGCSGLTAFAIGETVTQIGKKAFDGCTGPDQLDVPDSVKNIGASAFAGVDKVTFAEDPDDWDEAMLDGMFGDVYVPQKSRLLAYCREERISKLHTGVKLGHYLVGINYSCDRPYMSRKITEQWGDIKLTRSVEPGNIMIRFRSKTNGSILAEEKAAEASKEEINSIVIGLSPQSQDILLPAQTQVYIELAEGAFEENGEHTEVWDSSDIWCGTTMPDIWSEQNPDEPICAEMALAVDGILMGGIAALKKEGDKGICFGMSLSYLLMKYGYLSPSIFGAEDMYHVSRKSYGQTLGMTALEFWQLMHLVKNLPNTLIQVHSNKDLPALAVSAARRMLDGTGNPMLMQLDLDIGTHAVVPFAVKEDFDAVILYCYDSNTPESAGELIYKGGQWSYAGRAYGEKGITWVELDDFMKVFLTKAYLDANLRTKYVNQLQWETVVIRAISDGQLLYQWADQVMKIMEGVLYRILPTGGHSGLEGHLVPEERYVSEERSASEPGMAAEGDVSPGEGQSETDESSISYIYNVENGPLQIPRVPAGIQIHMKGSRGYVMVETSCISDVTILAAQEDTFSQVTVKPQRPRTYDILIHLAGKEDQEMLLHGKTGSGPVQIREDADGLWITGTWDLQVTAKDGDKEKTQVWTNLPEGKAADKELLISMEESGQGDDLQVSLRVDNDGNGSAESNIRPGDQSALDPDDPGNDPSDPGSGPADPGDHPTDPGSGPANPGDTPSDPGSGLPGSGTVPAAWLKTGTVVKDGRTNAKYKILSAGKVELTAVLNKNKTSVSVPDTVTLSGKSYQVTAIAAKAYKNNKKLKRVTIGKNVVSIGKNAFNGCKKLSRITIKTRKLTSGSVGAGAFKGISAKAAVKCPKARKKAYAKFLVKKGMKKTVKFH